MSDDNKVTLWKVISTLGKGVAKSVQIAADGASAAAKGVSDGKVALESSMPVTEITTIFNTTDKTVKFINRETARDSRDILAQTAVSLKVDTADGAWVPWYDPPRFGDWDNRHLAIIIDDVPVLYLWQKGDYIYWSNRLNSEGRPAKSYKMGGVAHVGGKRTLVIRNDPDAGYSCFMSTSLDTK
jgi:hypothetical protein